MTRAAAATCRHCVSFRNDPAFMERTFPGLAVLSSAWASVRADDGVCLRHDRHLSAEATCPDFSPAVLATSVQASVR